MIRISRGDLFESGCEALVNPVNCVGVMGKGLALQFRRRFQANYESYRSACAQGGLRPGRCHVVDTGGRPTRLIINFPTKRHWRDDSRIEDIAHGLNDLARIINAHTIGSVAVPALGCGLGGLPWPQVKRMSLERLAACSDTDIRIYEPATAPR